MSSGLHMLGVDSKKTSAAVFKALAEGLATGATGQRSYGYQGAYGAQGSYTSPYTSPEAQRYALEQQRLQDEESSTVWWYVAGGAAVGVALLFVLGRSR